MVPHKFYWSPDTEYLSHVKISTQVLQSLVDTPVEFKHWNMEKRCRTPKELTLRFTFIADSPIKTSTIMISRCDVLRRTNEGYRPKKNGQDGCQDRKSQKILRAKFWVWHSPFLPSSIFFPRQHQCKTLALRHCGFGFVIGDCNMVIFSVLDYIYILLVYHHVSPLKCPFLGFPWFSFSFRH